METVTAPSASSENQTIESVIAAVKQVAAEQIMPRYLKVAHQRKSDGSLFTEADLAAQEALTAALQSIYPGPVVGEEMSEERQVELWLGGEAGLWCVDPARAQRPGCSVRPGRRRGVPRAQRRWRVAGERAAADQIARAPYPQRDG